MPELARWYSPLSPKQIFSRQGAPAYPFYHSSGQLYWLESLTDDKGRLAITTQAHGEPDVITPTTHQVRTAVHEYGGKAFCVHRDIVYFNNYSDGLLYAQTLPTAEDLFNKTSSLPQALCTAIERGVGFTDITMASDGSCLLAVQEITQAPQNLNCISILPLTDEKSDAQVLVSGADFYACPCLSVDGKNLAWVQWNHPNMPWDSSEAYIADLIISDGSYAAKNIALVDGGEGISICQLDFLHDASLVYAKDADGEQAAPGNFWNLHHWRRGKSMALTSDFAEYGEAHWVFGQKRWQQMEDDSLLAIRTLNGHDQLVKVMLKSDEVQVLGDHFARLSQLWVSPNAKKICAIAQYAQRDSEIVEVAAINEYGVSTLVALPALLREDQVSKPIVQTYQTRDRQHAYAHYYASHNLDTKYSEDEPVPAIVMVHGGPTSKSDQSLSLLVQYFTSSGFAVIDVNHRGSTGLGRVYRQHLLGRWGEVDASDIADAVQHFVASGEVDANKVCIRGGSAGGYAVLRALTQYPSLFCAGACYYGIGNLITLCEITHKFESHYTDKLVGEVFNSKTAYLPDSRYITRSPIFEMEKVQSPIILFQGLDDKVVPPAVSREVVKVLERGNIEHEYIEYVGEGHGFRQAATRIDALEKEMQFYQRVLERSV